MIKSMTGFASVSHDDERGAIGVTVRAVNHRFLDLQLRLPPAVAEVEARLRAIVQKRLARGRVEVTVSLQLRQAAAPQVELNEEFARALAAAVDRARADGLVEGRLTPGDLLRLPQALSIRERPAEQAGIAEALAAPIEAALEGALGQLETMRVREGAHLRADFDGRTALLADLIGRIAAAAEAGRVQLEARLLERARSDITEEVTRFHGHLAHWDALADSDEPCGRKLDFLLQEMNREINTIGSKADGLQVSEVVIQAKAELERMREQVQNVE